MRIALHVQAAHLSSRFAAPEESSRACTAEDDLSRGRWVSKNHLSPQNLEPGSPFYDWIQTQVSLLFCLSISHTHHRSFLTNATSSVAVQSFTSANDRRIPSCSSPRISKLRLRLHSLHLQDSSSISFRMARRSETGYSSRDWRRDYSRLLLSQLGVRGSRYLSLLYRLGLS